MELYCRIDAWFGEILNKCTGEERFIVMSDHGFKPFIRGVNLNHWLYKNGYLALKPDAKGGKWLTDVDWSKTRAFQVGLGGLYLNVKGREAHGIVEPGQEAESLARELIDKLSGLPDQEKGDIAINQVWAARDIYLGPYVGNAPDLIIGYNVGYRASWDGATGVIGKAAIEDNTKAWSGDHCMDPRKIPGVLFTNFPLDKTDPSIMDIAPTVLERLGVEPPKYMDGEVLTRASK